MSAASGSGSATSSELQGAPAPSSTGRERRQKCHFFTTAKGCRRGDSCPYRHIAKEPKRQEDSGKNQSRAEAASKTDPDESTLEQSEAQGQNSSQQPGQAGLETAEDQVDSSHNQDSSSQVTRKRNVSESSKDSSTLGVCRYYARTKRCRFGQRCRFAHVYQEKQTVSETTEKADQQSAADVDGKQEAAAEVDDQKDEAAENDEKKPDDAGKKSQNKPKRLCRYFKSGHCSMGERCRFWHPADVMDVHASDAAAEQTATNPPAPESALPVEHAQTERRNRPARGRGNHRNQGPGRAEGMLRYSLSSLSKDEMRDLRTTEITQLNKRFPRTQTLHDEDGKEFYQVLFVPTDPDWPFDVKEVMMLVNFPEAYPEEMMDVTFPEDENLPDRIRSHIKQKARDWVSTRHEALSNDSKVELMFRPFIKWLDRQIEEIFTEGLRQYKRDLLAKAAGVEFVSASQLQEQYPGEVEEEEDEEEEDSSEEDEEDDLDKENIPLSMQNRLKFAEYEDEDEEDDGDEHEADGPKPVTYDQIKRGTEVKLKELKLLENAATLQATKIGLVVQCIRCKQRTEMTTPPERVNGVKCIRCSTSQLVIFHSSIMHQNSSTLGFLDLQGCSAFDLILHDCHFEITCLECNKKANMEGLPPGQMKDSWCYSCHGKQRVSANGARFLELQPAEEIDTGKVHVVAIKKKRAAKDPAIKEGLPLPKNGACKHYRKSYRWFRFPCCGMTYPCDICHDLEEDHEFKYANRVICGYCCKEQPFAAERPCTGCGLSMTKKASAHWEGGKGCRDKVKMAKSDHQKYEGINKTVSRKAQAKLPGNKTKKVTKLRHT